jgi:hypothetical protein
MSHDNRQTEVGALLPVDVQHSYVVMHSVKAHGILVGKRKRRRKTRKGKNKLIL